MPATTAEPASRISPRLRRVVRRLTWPLLLLGPGAILACGFLRGQETLYFNLSYAWLVLCLLLGERLLAFRSAWREADGQLGPDLAHTVLNKGLVQLFVVTLFAAGVMENPVPTGLAEWPLWTQVAFGLIASEFGLYWAHRLAHEWPWLWRFHAIHHSVGKLWLVNTGRFHFVDSFVSVGFSLPFLLLSGISMEAIIWVSAITAYIGILTHCNVDMRCGPLSLIFNTPELHRWHHSIDPAIGNRNYGENLMLWDHLFGTFFWRPGSSVERIGIRDHMPATFLAQLAQPFRRQTAQAAAPTASGT